MNKRDESNSELVAVEDFMDEINAVLAQQYLESQGIEAFVHYDDAGLIGQIRNASLFVERFNYDKAKKIIEEMNFE